MIKTTTEIILSLVCAVSYQGLDDEIEMKSLNRFVDPASLYFSPDFVRDGDRGLFDRPQDGRGYGMVGGGAGDPRNIGTRTVPVLRFEAGDPTPPRKTVLNWVPQK
jgi:hypothetical protein